MSLPKISANEMVRTYQLPSILAKSDSVTQHPPCDHSDACVHEDLQHNGLDVFEANTSSLQESEA